MSVKVAFPEFPAVGVAIDTVLLRTKDIATVDNRQVSPKQLQVLLVKKADEKEWHLPGTILRNGETPRDSIKRITEKKIDMGDIHFEQLYTVADDPERDERGHIISIVYIGMAKEINDIVADNHKDLYKAQWFWVGKEKKPNNERTFTNEETAESFSFLKYDHHTIVADTINRVKNKLMYTDIGFEFADSIFTIKELENIYEAIYERSIPAFRRFIENKIEYTEKMSDGKAFRPAKLFRKKTKH